MVPHGFVISEEKAPKLLTLIVDKNGVFGSELAKKIYKGSTTVLVTAREQPADEHVIAIPFTKTIPEIPEGNYTNMFFVWDGRSETLHVLEPLLKKASMDNAQFLFVTDYHCYSDKLVQFIHQEYSKASVILMGDVFGNGSYDSIITRFFNDAQEKETLLLDNVGLRYVYPVLFADVVAEILRVGFGGAQGKVFLACQQHGMTELSLAHVMQRVDPLLKIDFKKDEKEPVSLPEGEYIFDSSYNAARKLQDTYTDHIAGKRKNYAMRSKDELSFSPLSVKQVRLEKRKKKNTWMLGVLIVFLFAVSPIIITLTYAGLGGVALYAATGAIKLGNYNEAANLATTGESLFTFSLGSNIIVQKELNIVFLSRIGVTFTTVLEQGNFFASLLKDTANAANSFSLVAKGNSPSPSADFLSGINAIKSAMVTLNNITFHTSIDGIPLQTISEELQPFSSILDISQALFGFPVKKTYMVLFQNNMELRPGGGFIGSYALVTLDKGRVTDFTVHDVYDADGQLKGHIEPPYVIRRFIPEQHWYLRDSNFDVDFSQDAANAAYFLKQETGEKVDGVIGIDLTFVKAILAGVGPVYVPEYGQSVDADNFFLLTESHAEKNSFAGSTQKKDFLRALLSALQTKAATSHGFSPKAIVPLLAATKSKDVVFGFSDPLIQDVFTVGGLSSTLWDGRKVDNQVFNDTTGINEANIGVNKANYFVTRGVNQEMNIDDTGIVTGKLSIIYTNISKPGSWPGGDYKDYLRVILPQKAQLTSITIDGKKQELAVAVTDASVYEAKGFIAPRGLEVDSQEEEGKQLFGFVVNVPEEKVEKVSIAYALSENVDISKPTFTYSGWLIKQPGVEAYPYNFSLTVPTKFSLLQKPDWIAGSGNNFSFAKSFGEDTPFSMTFTQK